MKRRIPYWIFPLLLVLFFAGCSYDYINETDPDGTNYQGWPTYDESYRIQLVFPADGAEVPYTSEPYDLVCTEIIGTSDNYYFKIAEDAGFESIVLQETSQENRLSITPSSFLRNTTYYWLVGFGDDYQQTNSDTWSFQISDFSIGDLYAGGIIFYLDGSGGGLVCAESDLSDSSWIEWGPYGTLIGTATDVGSGEANTEAIVIACGDYLNGDYAAKLCYDLELEGYFDWFLPSKDELNLMYENLYLEGLGNFVDEIESYWSSSESGPDEAWIQFFGSGLQNDFNKYMGVLVRPVRSFTY